MKKIVLTRIDDRLIHGQVITAWTKFVNANSIVIVDEDLSKNKLMQRIYVAAAPTGIKLLILNIEEAVSYFNEDDADARVIILVKTPQIISKLIDKGIAISDIILGGMGANVTRSKLIRNVYTNQEERDSLKVLIDHGKHIHYQIVPDEKKTDLSQIL